MNYPNTIKIASSSKWSKIVLPLVIVAAIATLGVHLLTASHAATAYYVATTGSDTNAGTIAAPWRTVKKGLSSLHAGDTLIIHGGTYVENIQSITVSGTASSRITVQNASGERPIIEGLVWGTYNYVTFDGINVTWNPANTPDEHMMKFNGGTGWRWTNSEIWGAHSWANILIALSPDQWSIDHDVIHDNYGSPTETDVQEHNFYVHTDYNPSTSGKIEHNLIYNAVRGENIKLDGVGDGTGGGNNISIQYNTLYNANRGILIGGQSHGNTIAHNIDVPTTGAGDADAVYLYKNSGTGNSIHDNVFYNYKQLLLVGTGGNSGVVPMTNNTTGVDPQFDSSFHPGNAAVAGFGYYAGGSVTTPPPPPPPVDLVSPTVSMTGPSASVTVLASATLTANATDNVGVTHVDFYNGTTLLGQDSAAPYSFVWNTSKVANGKYTITAKAFDAANNVGISAPLVLTVNNVVPVTDTQAPSLPTALHSTALTSSSASLAWTASTDNVGVTGYDVLRNGVKVGTTTSPAFTNTGLSASTTYSYNVVAFDAAGNRSANSASLVLVTAAPTGPTADTQAPTVPENVKTSVVSPTIVNVSWSASSDNVGVVDYVVQRNGVSIAIVQGTSYSDIAVSPGVANSYKILARDAAGNVSAASAAATVTTPEPPTADTTAPSVPANLKATSVSSNEIDLAWSASTDNVGVKGYAVYRDNVQIATVTTTSFGDATLAAGTSHVYQILALDAAGNRSAFSTSVNATTQSVTASAEITLSAISKTTTTSSDSIKVVRPTQLVAGMTLIATIDVRGTPTVTAPTGWKLLRKDTASTGNVMVTSTYIRTAVSSEPASYTWKFSTAQDAVGMIVSVSGASSAKVVTAGKVNTASDTITAPSATSVADGSLVLGLFSTASNSTIKSPDNMTSLGSASSTAGSYDIATQISWRDLPKISSAGTERAAASNTSVNTGELIILAPTVQ